VLDVGVDRALGEHQAFGDLAVGQPVGEQVAEKSSATSKSAVSRRFVAMTETALGELLAADLSGLDLVAVMIDGVHFAEHVVLAAVGIDLNGVKHPLGLSSPWCKWSPVRSSRWW